MEYLRRDLKNEAGAKVTKMVIDFMNVFEETAALRCDSFDLDFWDVVWGVHHLLMEKEAFH